MEYVEVGGLRIAFQRIGQGPPLILLHGILADSRMWRLQLESLSSQFTVMAWDAPGCGQSSDPPETFRLPEYAACLAGFLDALDLEQAHILGISWGGGLALELYRQRPDLALTMILAAAYAGWAGSLPSEVVAERLATCLREAEMPPSQFVPGWIPGLLTDAAPVEMVDEVVSVMSEFHPAGYQAMALAFAEADLRHILPSVTAPTLLLYGEVDKRSPTQVAQGLHAKIPGSQLVILPEVGHLSNVEAAAQFNNEVYKFLQSHSP